MAEERTCKENPMKGIPLELNFTTFILSLSSSALVHLGEAPDPATGQTSESLHLAKQTIDILALLQDKIKNGLTDEESKILCELLYNLRMKYVSKAA